ncbi:MAG: DUF1566 domain-containing protein [Magnetococcales bacterium]|nr:DUF1566 domain-containing protein [Magnetococcales bacterium]
MNGCAKKVVLTQKKKSVAPGIQHRESGSMLLWVSFGMIALGSIIAATVPRATGLVNVDKATANEKVLVEMRNAIEGFAVANHRLPCPDRNSDGAEDCPLTNLTTDPRGNVPYRSIGLASGNDVYGIPVRYAVYAETTTESSSFAVGSINLTSGGSVSANGFLTKSNFGAALLNARTSSASYLRTVDINGNNPVNVPFILVSGGQSRSDIAGTDGKFDGHNVNSYLVFDRENRSAVAGSYDDIVVTSGFNRLALATNASRVSAFNGFFGKVGQILRRTGQTNCYGSAGASVSCSDTGQDGQWQKGVARDGARFTDNGNGTVTDNLTGLIWLKDAGCSTINGAGGVIWSSALTNANALASGACSLTDGSAAGQWRLPNRLELQSLFDYSRPSAPLLPSSHPFTGVSTTNYYWSSSSSAADSSTAWTVHFVNAVTDASSHNKTSSSHLVWPVRDGQSNVPAQVPQTGQTFCYDSSNVPITNCTCYDGAGATVSCVAAGACFSDVAHTIPVTCPIPSGQDGQGGGVTTPALRKGVVPPSPRFTNNSDGTVTDNLTGLTWLANADCSGGTSTWTSALSFANALANGSCGLTDNSVAGDWRLPNVIELNSLLDMNNSPALPSGYGSFFSNVRSGGSDYYWVSSTPVFSATDAWRLQFARGSLDYGSKSASSYAWPVRGGK